MARLLPHTWTIRRYGIVCTLRQGPRPNVLIATARLNAWGKFVRMCLRIVAGVARLIRR